MRSSPRTRTPKRPISQSSITWGVFVCTQRSDAFGSPHCRSIACQGCDGRHGTLCASTQKTDEASRYENSNPGGVAGAEAASPAALRDMRRPTLQTVNTRCLIDEPMPYDCSHWAARLLRLRSASQQSSQPSARASKGDAGVPGDWLDRSTILNPAGLSRRRSQPSVATGQRVSPNRPSMFGDKTKMNLSSIRAVAPT